MMATKDSFSIDISLHHRDPLYSPEDISNTLSIKPLGAYPVGVWLGKSRSKWSSFYARLQEGDHTSEYQGALAKVTSFLEKNAAFWTEFVSGEGEVVLVLNHTIHPGEEERDKCFELYLAPAFLTQLSTRGIGLKVQGWQGASRRRSSGSGPRDRQHSDSS